MKYIAVVVLVCLMGSFLAIGVDSKVTSSSSELSISAPIEEVWAALSAGKNVQSVTIFWIYSIFRDKSLTLTRRLQYVRIFNMMRLRRYLGAIRNLIHWQINFAGHVGAETKSLMHLYRAFSLNN